MRPRRRAAPRECGRSPFAIRGEAAARLEHPDVAPFPATVVDARVDETRQQRWPQDSKLLGKRIGDGGRFDPRSAEGQGSLPLDKGKRHRLGEAGGEKYPPETAMRAS